MRREPLDCFAHTLKPTLPRRSQFATFDNFARQPWSVIRPFRDILNLAYHEHGILIEHSTKDNMFPVEPVTRACRDEELAAI